ncbi:MAG TPA: class I SAM-dependent methyltransferase [Smithellaceae bacterium]|nr:class I SAM-dependent methyltransferase [Smithellaceae bacterium]
MGYALNTTDDYHLHGLTSLGWELTLCNALFPKNSPCRGALLRDASFGEYLFRFLDKNIPLKRVKTVLEVGGGMGYLMRDLLTLAPHLQTTMADISPFLLQRQKESLAGFSVSFLETDFFKMPLPDLRAFDLVILNEVLGDFPTLAAESEPSLSEDPAAARLSARIADFETTYGLRFAPAENINIGALEAVERLCQAGVPCIYLSEHSCESFFSDPSFPSMNFAPSGNPEKISLKGHAEFTIKFSALEKVARAFSYEALRGPYTDLLPVSFNDRVTAALRAPTPLSGRQEILRQFLYDLHKYEYLLLTLERQGKDRT